MIDPPDGRIPPLLLALAYKLAWRASKRDRTGRAVGILHDDEDGSFRLAAVRGASPGTMDWRLVQAAAPDGVAAYLLPENTAWALRRGHLAADGTLEHEGARYRVRAVWIAPDHVAE